MALGGIGSLVGMAAVALDLETEAFHRKLELAEHELKSSSSRMGGAVKAGAAVAAGGLVLLGAELISATNAAKKHEVAQAQLQVAMKDAGVSWRAHSREVQNSIDRLSELSGINRNEVASSMALMVRTTGSVTVATRLNAIAADVSKAKNMGLVQAQSLLARAYDGSFQGLKRLGIEVPKVTEHVDALRAAHVKVTPELMRQAQELDKLATRTQVLDLVQQKFAGNAAAYGKTAAGAQDRFRVAAEELQSSIGEGLLPILASVTGKLADWVNQLRKSEGFHKQVERVVEELRKAWQVTVTVLEHAWKVLKDVTGFLQRHKAILDLVKGALVTLTAGYLAFAAVQKVIKAVTAAQAALNAVMDANVVTIVVVAVVALGAALYTAYQRSETFRRIVDATFSTLKRVGLDALHAITDAVTATIDWVRSHWRLLAYAGGGILLGPFGILVAYVATHFDQVRKKVGEVFDWLERHAIETARKIVEPFSHLPGGLGRWARKAKDELQAQLDAMDAAAAKSGAAAGTDQGKAYVSALGPYAKQAGSLLAGPGGGLTAPAAAGSSLFAQIAAGARARGLDPRAVLSVASVEGGPTGKPGDVINGRATSFGPFQLHEGGALPARFAGDAAAASAWANSPAGIKYALDRLAGQSGARGQSGLTAISSIVRGFEHPSAPGAEIQRALGVYNTPTALASVGGGGSTADLAKGKRKLVQLALQMIGTPYLWGGNAPGGFDCSGLVQWAFAQEGVTLPHFTGAQMALTTPVTRKQAQPGDIVFTNFGETQHGKTVGANVPGHEGLYVGNGMVLQAPHTGDAVKLTPFDQFTRSGRYQIGRVGAAAPRDLASSGSPSTADAKFQARIRAAQQAQAQAKLNRPATDLAVSGEQYQESKLGDRITSAKGLTGTFRQYLSNELEKLSGTVALGMSAHALGLVKLARAKIADELAAQSKSGGTRERAATAAAKALAAAVAAGERFTGSVSTASPSAFLGGSNLTGAGMTASQIRAANAGQQAADRAAASGRAATARIIAAAARVPATPGMSGLMGAGRAVLNDLPDGGKAARAAEDRDLATALKRQLQIRKQAATDARHEAAREGQAELALEKVVNDARVQQQADTVARMAAQADQDKQKLADAWKRVADAALRSYDRETSKHLDQMRRDVDAHVKAMQKDAAAAVAAARGTTSFGQIGEGEQTPAEKALQALQDQHDAADQARQDADAQKQLDDARASGDQAAIDAAQQAVDERAYQRQLATLQRQATVERQEADKAIAAAQQQEQERQDALQQGYQDEQAIAEQAYQDQRDLQREAYQDELDQLGLHLGDRQATLEGANAEVTKVMGAGGKDAGDAYVKAVADALAQLPAVYAAAGVSAQAVAQGSASALAGASPGSVTGLTNPAGSRDDRPAVTVVQHFNAAQPNVTHALHLASYAAVNGRW